MTQQTPRRFAISTCLITILIIYVVFNLMISKMLISEPPSGIFPTLIALFNQFGWNFTREFSLVVMPSAILIIIYINKIDLKIRVLLGRIISFISFLTVLINLTIISFDISQYYSLLGLFELSSASAIFFFIFLIQSILFLIIFLSLTIKIEL